MSAFKLSRSINQPRQSTNHILMVRPHHFYVNPQTVLDNAYQSVCTLTAEQIKVNAYAEVTHAVATLRSHGIKVKLFEDRGHKTPDSVFPNNWFSTHQSGELIFYPMLVENRRLERRTAIMSFLQKQSWHSVINYTQNEQNNEILEGTGAVIFDHINQCFYAARSKRTSDKLIAKLAEQLNMQPIIFDTEDEYGQPIYHTNVMMGLGSTFVLVCLDVINSLVTRQRLYEQFKQTGKEVILISMNQVKQFCGNVLELNGRDGPILALSTTAYAALTDMQKHRLSQHAYLQPIHIPTIELAGGSIRCMIAELF
jgi:hypothetical protein